MDLLRRVLRAPRAARTWKELLYCTAGLPLAVLGIAALAVTLLLGAGSVAAVLLPLLALLLAADRGIGALRRGLARRLLGLSVAAPPRRARRSSGGPLRRLAVGLVNAVTDPGAWRAVGYFLVHLPVAALEFALGTMWFVYALSRLLYPVLWQVQRAEAVRPSRSAGGLQIGGFVFDTWPRALLVVCGGALLLLVWPWVMRLPLALDRVLIRRLLGPTAVSLRVAHLEETRAHAVNEAAATVRRIERDLHDGAQAQLIALGLKIGRAERRLDRDDPAGAQALLAEARAEARTIVAELRELVRGVHPPVLDAGLAPALTTLAARAPLPTTVGVELDGPRPGAAVETLLYFAAAELLANAGKYGDARSAAVTVRADGPGLVLTVADDGTGGATLTGTGSGLRGLAERARAADGELTVDSPPGGPTTVTLSVPLPG